MPWKECQKMDEKLRFVSRHLEGESISQLCREFGISRVTGHKLVERYRQNGLEAFSDRSMFSLMTRSRDTCLTTTSLPILTASSFNSLRNVQLVSFS